MRVHDSGILKEVRVGFATTDREERESWGLLQLRGAA
jgi:hypothetical protein